MGILSLLEARSRIENPQVPISQASVLEHFGIEATPAGVTVTHDRALGVTAFWCGVATIADTIAYLPIHVYERMPNGGRRLATEHPVYGLLHDRPNPYMSPFTWKEIRAAHCITWGNSYAEVQRDNAGRPIGLWPLLPDRTDAEVRDGVRRYWTQTDGARVFLADDRVLHVPGLSYDGVRGYNVIRAHREALGMTIASNEYGARFFGNSGRPSGYIAHPGKPGVDERAQLREEWNQLHTGLTNAQRTAILWGGMKWEPMSVPPEEAQFLQTRELQIEEVARILRINPILLQHFTKATTWGSGIAQFLVAYAKFTIGPWLVRDEDAMNYTLFTPEERGRFYVKYNINGLLRGDMKEQAEILEIKRRNGVVNADEWRELDEENPLPEGIGKHYMMPLNMAPVEAVVPEAEGDVAAGEDVQATALNGAQIASLLSILQLVTQKQLSPDAAKAALAAGFPSLSAEQIAGMVDSSASFEPEPQGGEAQPESEPDAGAAATGAGRTARERRVQNAREERGLLLRKRHRNAYLRVFADGVTRYVRRDVEAAGRAVARAFDTPDPVAALNRWIDEFYPGQRHAITRIMLPIVTAFAENIAADAADEVGASAPAVDGMAAEFTDALASRETSSSIGQLRALMAAEPLEALRESLDTRLAEWTEKRPAKVAADEVVRAGTAATILAWRSAGIPDMRWRASPDACPLCQRMDGVIVSTGGRFVDAGDSVAAEGTEPLRAEYDIAGPPLHQGCQCDIVPER